ncbi:hypothetical protein EI94DRAFT_1703219 [Lactarius quietus]|nr:hypothetical protein EI94DRAFT_1703219 [Lactarius quietus]
MEGAKKHLCMNTSNVTPEFIEQWDICKIMNSVSSNTPPTLTTVLNAACESKASHARVKTAKSKNQGTVFIQGHYRTSRQMIDVLHRTGLLVSYSSIAKMAQALADHSVERAWAACLHPHALVYDNINVSSLIFVKQGRNMMSKVPLGTFRVINELCNAQSEDILLDPLINNFDDLNSSVQEICSFTTQSVIHVVKVLVRVQLMPADPKYPLKELESGEGLARPSVDITHDNIVLLMLLQPETLGELKIYCLLLHVFSEAQS